MSTFPRIAKWWWVLPLLALLLFAADRGFDAAVRARLQQAARDAAGPGYQVDLGKLRIDLFGGSLELEDIRVTHDSLLVDSLLAGARRGLISVKAERVSVLGVAYWDLLWKGNVRVRHIELTAPEIEHLYASQLVGEDKAAKAPQPDLPERISLDSLVVLDARASITDVRGAMASSRIEQVDIRLGDMRLLADGSGLGRLLVGSAFIGASEVSMEFPPLYDLRMASMVLTHPAGTASITGLQLMPRANEQQYHKLVHYETDLFRTIVDTLRMEGMDVAGYLALGVLYMDKLEICNPVLHVYRDKTMPDAPWVHKPLIASAVRDLGIQVAVDTILLNNGTVSYHERDEASPDYGTVEFTSLNGRISGFNNNPAFASDGGTMRVHATAKIYDRSTIRMDLTVPLDDANDRFTVSAYLNTIPFQIFNQMTDSLLQVEATSGRIHTLVMHMHGNDRTGHGTVDMEYEDLRIAINPGEGAGLKDKLMGFAANTIIRRNNLRSRNSYRQGEFEIDRRRDRAIFNFLWNGLKAGSIDTVVPGMLREMARKASAPPDEKDMRKKNRKKK
jgi:hypothetical protein